MNTGRGAAVAAPQNPPTSLSVGASWKASADSAGPMVGIALAVLGGLVLLYVTTRRIQGTK